MKQEAPQPRHKPPRESSDLQSEEHVNHTSSPWGGHRLSRLGKCLLPRSTCRLVQHADRWPPELPVHRERSVHRHPQQPRRRIRNVRTI